MNYIELINEFWRFYDNNSTKINTSDIVMYNVLMRYCNKLNWINPFFVEPYLMSQINPLSVNTYYKSLQNLHDLEIIEYQKGKHNVNKAKITILKINNSLNNSIENSIKFSLVSSVVNSVVNNNKTIILLNNETIKQYKEKDFEFLIKSKEFKKYCKSENLEFAKIPKINKVFKSKEEEIKETGNYILKFNTHLSISSKEYDNLVKNYGNEKVNDKLDAIDNDSNSKKYKSLNLTAQNWLKRDKINNNEKPKTKEQKEHDKQLAEAQKRETGVTYQDMLIPDWKPPKEIETDNLPF